ncbi:glucosaminidase domain-containing protein [Candidatus Oscillochloris fontis]|uniref:glucosaminidase domain-containing protein n=1 Tax=Candidatus Oscillochloris fontis TaxID=2496868 RepID=UPI001EE846D3|nr:glucosaminidase domain-containing protein [Candidatus Oscillochloris fontis]
MNSADNRRSGTPRRRREPLFPLEPEDIEVQVRRGPPAPLHDILGDLDAAFPTRVDLPHRERRTPPTVAPRAHSSPPAPRSVQVDPRPTPRPRPMQVAPPDHRLREAKYEHDYAESLLHQAERLTARLPHTEYRAPYTSHLPLLNQWFMLGVVAVISLLVLFVSFGSSSSVTSRWGTLLFADASQSVYRLQLSGAANPAGDHHLQGSPSISVQEIDAILAAYGSPAAGTGALWYNLGLEYGIDPAYAVAFFIHESSAGTNQGWAGLKPDGSSTHNVGNIICAGYATCYGRFRDYPSWEAGIADWYRLIDVEYIQGRGTLTVADIIPIYAPSFENDVQAYVDAVTTMVDGWRINGVR